MRYVYKGSEAFGAAIEERMAAAGFERCEDEGSADVALTFCLSQSAIEDAYFDEGGLVQSMRPGSLLIDLSASTPGSSREVSAVAEVSDLAYAEAPLAVASMVDPHAFSRENLLCYLAGEEDGAKRARPVLDALVGEVRCTGSVGTAQLARSARTLQMCAQAVSAIEADALRRAVRRAGVGEELGAEPPEPCTKEAAAVLEAVRSQRFDGPYTVEMLMADLSAALMAADDADLILPQAESTQHLLELLAVIGGTDKAPSAVSLVYGEEAECAAQGLDWARAEQAYGEHSHDDDEDEDDGEDDGYGSGYGFDYSTN